jgi:acyl-coenzyme A synthetase/AMP-(fatty) acid ligase
MPGTDAYLLTLKIDSIPLGWATHELGGIVSPANAAYSADELKHQLLDSKAKAMFTCVPLLPTALKAASAAGLPKDRIYLIDVLPGSGKIPTEFKTLSQIVEEGKSLPKLEKLKWGAGEGARRTAYLCYSSGTSGLPVSNHPPDKGHFLSADRALERSNDCAPQCYCKCSADDGFREIMA